MGSIVEGEDPPDYYVLMGSKKIALEITTAESIFNEESESVRKRTSTESVAMLSDELNKELKGIVPSEKSLLLILKPPINNFGRFKKQLKLILMKILQEHDFLNKKLNIDDEIVEVRWVSNDSGYHKGIIGVIGDKNPIVNIQEQTILILERIIKDKMRKLQRVNGEKWLGIINNYPLAEHHNFSQALHEVTISHDFSKIFLVGNNSIVMEVL